MRAETDCNNNNSPQAVNQTLCGQRLHAAAHEVACIPQQACAMWPSRRLRISGPCGLHEILNMTAAAVRHIRPSPGRPLRVASAFSSPGSCGARDNGPQPASPRGSARQALAGSDGTASPCAQQRRTAARRCSIAASSQRWAQDDLEQRESSSPAYRGAYRAAMPQRRSAFKFSRSVGASLRRDE